MKTSFYDVVAELVARIVISMVAILIVCWWVIVIGDNLLHLFNY